MAIHLSFDFEEIRVEGKSLQTICEVKEFQSIRIKPPINYYFQVKVWFQNRRTKHKRMQQEEDAKSGGGDGKTLSSSPGNHNDSGQISYDEDDESIDMEMDDECPSDEDIEQDHHPMQQHHH